MYQYCYYIEFSYSLSSTGTDMHSVEHSKVYRTYIHSNYKMDGEYTISQFDKQTNSPTIRNLKRLFLTSENDSSFRHTLPGSNKQTFPPAISWAANSMLKGIDVAELNKQIEEVHIRIVLCEKEGYNYDNDSQTILTWSNLYFLHLLSRINQTISTKETDVTSGHFCEPFQPQNELMNCFRFVSNVSQLLWDSKKDSFEESVQIIRYLIDKLKIILKDLGLDKCYLDKGISIPDHLNEKHNFFVNCTEIFKRGISNMVLSICTPGCHFKSESNSIYLFLCDIDQYLEKAQRNELPETFGTPLPTTIPSLYIPNITEVQVRKLYYQLCDYKWILQEQVAKDEFLYCMKGTGTPPKKKIIWQNDPKILVMMFDIINYNRWKNIQQVFTCIKVDLGKARLNQWASDARKNVNNPYSRKFGQMADLLYDMWLDVLDSKEILNKIYLRRL